MTQQVFQPPESLNNFGRPFPFVDTDHHQSPDIVPIIIEHVENHDNTFTNQTFEEGGIHSDYLGVVDNPFTLRASRVLVAETYLRRGYVQGDDITEEGYIGEHLDPHVDDSTYFANLSGGIVKATARLISKEAISDFPAFKEFGIDPTKLNIDQDASQYREVSALAKSKEHGKRQDVLEVYASMMKHSINEDGRYWLMSVDEDLVKTLKQLFGKKSFTDIGEPEFVMGSTTVPMLLDTHKALKLMDKPYIPRYIKSIFRENLQGLDETKLSDDVLKIMRKHGVINTEKDTVPFLKRPKTWATGALASYAVARAGVIPLYSLDDHGVNMWTFLALDLATVPPYVEGLSRFQDRSSAAARRVGGVALAATSFAAPYAYVVHQAHESPNFLGAGATFMAMLGVATVGGRAWEKGTEVLSKFRAQNPTTPQ